MKSWQFNNHVKRKTGMRLYITTGKHKGKIGIVTDAWDSKIGLKLDDDTEIHVPYTGLEELDENDQCKIYGITDMTGRPVETGSHVCYSVSDGQNSHGLEIGKVVEITKVGLLKVRRLVKNGSKIEKFYSYGGNKEEKNIDPFRAIKLPVDDATMVMWVLQEFSEIDAKKSSQN